MFKSICVIFYIVYFLTVLKKYNILFTLKKMYLFPAFLIRLIYNVYYSWVMQNNTLTQVPIFSFVPTIINMSTQEINTQNKVTNNLTQVNNDQEEDTERRNVRARIMNGHGLVTLDRSLRIPLRFIQVDIEHMMSENPERKNAVMYLQLLRVISGSNNNGQSSTSTYQAYFRKNKKDSCRESHFIRLFLFRYVSSKDGHVCYMTENRNHNDKLWNRLSILRDNVTVTIGCYICLINPSSVTNFFYNEVPQIKTHGSCILMDHPPSVSEIDIDRAITNDTTRSFVKK